MAIFAVLGLDEESTGLEAVIRETFPENYYVLAQDKWLIAASGETSKSVALKLGMIKGSGRRGIVIQVGGYYGLASPDVWEWVRAKSTVDA
jgi:hypothetical protein